AHTVDENTNPIRQTWQRKSIDRHPSYILKINTHDSSSLTDEELELENTNLVRDIVTLLQAMVGGFLEADQWNKRSLAITGKNDSENSDGESEEESSVDKIELNEAQESAER